MKRWLVFALGLAIVGAALYGLAVRRADAPPALDEIDPASRERLERLLREAEREESNP